MFIYINIKLINKKCNFPNEGYGFTAFYSIKKVNYRNVKSSGLFVE